MVATKADGLALQMAGLMAGWTVVCSAGQSASRSVDYWATQMVETKVELLDIRLAAQ